MQISIVCSVEGERFKNQISYGGRLNMKRINLALIAAVLALVLVFAGCKTNNAPSGDAPKEGSYAEMKGEDLDKIEEDNKEKEKYLVLDVRSADQYNEGHVKHAINMPVDELDGRIAEIEAYKDKNVVTVCNTGKKSSEAAQKLVDAGFKNVWNAQGVKDFNYTTMTKAATLLPEEFKKRVESGEYTVVDVRDEKDYNEGHMKDAIHTTVDTADADIETFPTDKPFLTYCYSGNRSWTVADKLAQKGYEVYNAWDGTKEYDGYELVK